MIDMFQTSASSYSGAMKASPSSSKKKMKKKIGDEILTDEEKKAIAKKVNKNMKANTGLFEMLGGFTEKEK